MINTNQEPHNLSEPIVFLGVAIVAGKKIMVLSEKIGEKNPDLIWTLPTIRLDRQTVLIERDPSSVFKLASEIFTTLPIRSAQQQYITFGSRIWTDVYVKIVVAVYKDSEENLSDYVDHCPKEFAFSIEDISTVFADNSVVDTALSICGASLRMLVESVAVSPAVLELSPELRAFDRDHLEQLSAEELWSMAYPTYALYLDGQAGGSGWIPKRVILDRRIALYLSRYLISGSRVLDFGGGNGTLRHLDHVPYQIDIIDLDYHEDNMGRGLGAEEVEYDGVICSLVVPWVYDLSALFMRLYQKLHCNGIALITLPNPAIYHTGRWLSMTRGEFVIQEKPPSYGTLAMIGRIVGPLKLYARTAGQIVSVLGKSGFGVIEIDDTPTTNDEESLLLDFGFQYPYLYKNIGPFVIIIARKI